MSPTFASKVTPVLGSVTTADAAGAAKEKRVTAAAALSTRSTA
jgi:hypothetical protein